MSTDPSMELAALENTVDRLETEVARLTAELEEARKDAARYRWLVREACTGSIGFGGDGGWIDATDRDQWSEWIDAAMTKDKPHGSL